jgi:NAD(P)-dependent dehydrogenase (short-subunit alcohol dehydrogenase family)
MDVKGKESAMSDGCRRLAGRVAIVTGAAAGIGRAIARRFAAEGAAVAVVDRKEEWGSETARLIRDEGGDAHFIACDVADAASVRAMVADAAGAGRIDVLVNNAGIPGSLVPIDQMTEDDWDRVIAVNLRGVFLCCKYAIPHLEASGHGAIVNIASTFGMVGAPATPAYAASKGGVIALTRQLAVDYGPRGIRVNAVSPGYVDNDMDQRRSRMTAEQAASNLAARQSAAALQPIGRQADVAEIAAAVAFLASDDASFATGAILPIDGGCTAFFNLGRR